MVDKRAPHPWARAQNRLSKCGKTNNILLVFAHRDTPDTYTKGTRNQSVIYPPPKDQKETNKNKINSYHYVFLNTKPSDLHPYASPEGLGTTPFEGYQRWPKTRPRGAAMRLTALRQPPTGYHGTQRNPGTLKQIRNTQTFFTPSYFATAGLFL